MDLESPFTMAEFTQLKNNLFALCISSAVILRDMHEFLWFVFEYIFQQMHYVASEKHSLQGPFYQLKMCVLTALGFNSRLHICFKANNMGHAFTINNECILMPLQKGKGAVYTS